MRSYLRSLAAGLLLTATGAAGCALPTYNRGVGFYASVELPATVNGQVPVQQTTGPLAIGGVGAGPVAGAVTAAAPGRMLLMQAQPPLDPCQAGVPFGAPGPSPSGRGPVLAQSAGGACTLDDLCEQQRQTLEAIRQLARQQATSLPMPKGVP